MEKKIINVGSLLLLSTLLTFNTVYANLTIDSKMSIKTCLQRDTILPDIFILGQNVGTEDILDEKFSMSLVQACNGDASRAFEAWAGMLLAMERFGDQNEFDVKGIKAFATVYWDKNGNIKHIGYSLKPYSRNLKPEDLEKFFRRFMETYRFPVRAKSKFQHTFTLALPYPREIIRIDKTRESSTTSKSQ